MIDPSLRAVRRSRYTILRFFALFGLLLGALLLLLFVITAYAPAGSPFRESATNFLGNFAATVAVFIAIYLFYVLITPPGLRDAEVVPMRDVEIGDGIINLPANASDYWFWGRSGSYFRSAVLPGWTILPVGSAAMSESALSSLIRTRVQMGFCINA
jgi:hypothetical protein